MREPTPPSELAKDLPRDLERIILRCLRKDPARRFQHMADLAVELEEIKTESGDADRRGSGAGAARAARVVDGVGGCDRCWQPRVPGSCGPNRVRPLPSPTVVPLTAFPGDERFPTFSPDGNQVAFAWNGEKGDNTDIYVMPVGAATPLRLTTDPAEDTAPAWSPDGSQIAFVRRQGIEAPSISPRRLCRTQNRSSRTSVRWPSTTTTSPRSPGSRMASGWPSLSATWTAK